MDTYELKELIERIEIDEREGLHWTSDAIVAELKKLIENE